MLKIVEERRKIEMTKTFSPGMNKSLWKDSESYSVFAGVYLQLIHHLTTAEDYEVSSLLSYANQLDDLMQEYEDKYGSIEDPQFYWAFATANAYFLFQGGKDEIGASRGQYVISGYMAALERHTLYPSLSADCIDEALGNMASFVDEDGKRWISENHNKYTPLPWGHELLDQKNARNENIQYRVVDFVINDEIYIYENAQTAPYYPLTIAGAKNFFNHFARETFEFNGIVKSIFIFSGKYYPSGTSFADGYLYSKSLTDIERLPEHEEFASHILFEYRENDRLRITIG